jgi:N-acetylglucosamine-6-phosphate deacetylase
MIQATQVSAVLSPELLTPPRPTTLITNVRMPGYDGLKRVWIDPQGIVQSIQTMDQSFDRLPPEDLQVLDLGQDWLSLGGVDLQINGALGLAFPDLDASNADRLPGICEFLWQQGVDAFMPTIVTAAIPQIKQSLATIAAYCAQIQPRKAARILGVHLEGPCLNRAKRGAHPETHLQPLTIAVMEELLVDHGAIVKMVTLAPELDPSGAVIAYLRDRGILVSLGHSQATARQAKQAFDQGATLVTHAFNAMPGLHHREPGLLGAALVEPGVRCGVIADGQHVSPIMLQLLLRAAGGCSGTSGGTTSTISTNGLFLVSDALAPLGLADGRYPWDSREITVTDGTARLGDGTLSGTTLPLLAGVRNLVAWGICSIDEAIGLATVAPRLAVSITDRSNRDHRHYIGRRIHELLRWRQTETQPLTWQRLV